MDNIKPNTILLVDSYSKDVIGTERFESKEQAVDYMLHDRQHPTELDMYRKLGSRWVDNFGQFVEINLVKAGGVQKAIVGDPF